MVKTSIERQDTQMRPAISANESLSCVLRFLATGESYRSLEFQSRISLAFLSERVPEICKALYENLRGTYLQFPEGEQWNQIANQFEARWHFPLCIGALDGKHVAFRASKTDGSLYYNYKGFNSVVLLAMCDAEYKFLFVDIGCNGRISDGGVLSRSDLARILLQADRFLPRDKVIGNNRLLPYVIVGDDAFPLEKHLMKPFPYHTNSESEKNFNFRLSHARQTIEHAFGILSNRFRVLQSNIHLRPPKVIKIIQACCVLHNFLITKSVNYVTEINVRSSETPANVENDDGHRTSNPRRHSNEAGEVRNIFSEYFNNEGKLFYV
ncbi:putative nuclease HARBI1 [Episyrphus balteatus]|uniref:putative nuclease HARBI1 n=1 Tax=Episyrphus balteatus TaxID=286459 RepID=UPI0024851DE8|nr:putative nuclease HARBI1 [Episyrphus balteatus]